MSGTGKKPRMTPAERVDEATGWVVALFLLILAGAVAWMVVGNVYYYIKLN